MRLRIDRVMIAQAISDGVVSMRELELWIVQRWGA